MASEELDVPPPAAVHVRVAYCTDGSFVIDLLDAASAVIARAQMTREQLAKHIGMCADVADQVSRGGLALMPAGGSA